MKWFRVLPGRVATEGSRSGKAVAASLTGLLVLLSMPGCSIVDPNVLAACQQVNQGRYVDPAGCYAAQARADAEKARRSENRRAAEQQSARRRNASRPRPLTAAQRRQASARTEAASRGPRKRWDKERQLARRENRANLRRYPRIAGLSGMWCGLPSRQVSIRYEILPSGQIRRATFVRRGRNRVAKFSEITYAVRREGGLYMMIRTWKGRYKIPYQESAIEKDGENRYSVLWTRTVGRKGPGRKTRFTGSSAIKFVRCETG